ncbi:hypothetical protein [Bradyrhizobium sp. CCBAU 51753]|uniref:hypothetical protein n=1 Tax=Bradyrhizobium sp. CCBAU 51753 TaxID=1325100 RepID=UPI00188B0617|nr:hypothetical protein [Bradyrhizobium sp. CCBAU 51753]
MRQMPHGQWVAFENNEPHRCDSLMPPRQQPSSPLQLKPVEPLEFPDINIPEDHVRHPAPVPGPAPRLSPVQPRPTQPKDAPSAPLPPDRPSRSPPSRQLAPAPRQPLPQREAPPAEAVVASSRKPAGAQSVGVLQAAATIMFTGYVFIGVLHSIAFSLFVSRVTCVTTTKTIISIFCNTGLGISHLVAVLGWPFYWL